jgi:hypothetical protein
MSAPQSIFGAGKMWITPVTDANGDAVTVPTPVKVLACQGITTDLKFDTKMMHGRGQFPIHLARGKATASVSVEHGEITGRTYNHLFFGQTLATGRELFHEDETGAAIPGTPYKITPPPPSSGTWAEDLGVRDANGLPMKRVASAPATGEYAVAAGEYEFAAADTTKTVYIDYRYTVSTGSKIEVVGKDMGSSPIVQVAIQTSFEGQHLTFRFPRCVAKDMSIQTKLDDFVYPKFNFDVYANTVTKALGTISFSV